MRETSVLSSVIFTLDIGMAQDVAKTINNNKRITEAEQLLHKALTSTETQEKSKIVATLPEGPVSYTQK
jgi:hypothetical protein